MEKAARRTTDQETERRPRIIHGVAESALKRIVYVYPDLALVISFLGLFHKEKMDVKDVRMEAEPPKGGVATLPTTSASGDFGDSGSLNDMLSLFVGEAREQGEDISVR